MTEWGVVSVIIVLIGLLVTVSAPVIYVTKSLTKLNAVTESMLASLNGDRAQNQQAHDKLWQHNDEQDARINDHETRIRLMEEVE